MTDATAAPSTTRVISAGLIGNVLEWYDFAVYGYFAHIIGSHFFPSTDPAVSLIAAFGAFAAGFLVRPIGGLVFGAIGDLIGRKRALQLSVLCMAVPTVLIAVLPTYAQIGMAAPILIVLLRIAQGLSVGGEYTGSMVFLAEHAKVGKRGFIASWGMTGAVAGILLGSGVGTLLTNVMSEADVAAWGWRIPFAMGLLVALSGILLRRGMQDDALAKAEDDGEKQVSLHTAFLTNWRTILIACGTNIALGTVFYAAFVYSVTYISSVSKLSSKVAFDVNTAALAVMLVAIPFCAILSDRIGRRPMILTGYALLAIGAVPIYELMHHPDATMVFLGEAALAVALSIAAGGMIGANVELFPKSIRCTGLAFSYNTAVGIFGGTTPMICAALIAESGNPVSPGFWVAGTAAVSLLVAIFYLKETAFKRLDY